MTLWDLYTDHCSVRKWNTGPNEIVSQVPSKDSLLYCRATFCWRAPFNSFTRAWVKSGMLQVDMLLSSHLCYFPNPKGCWGRHVYVSLPCSTRFFAVCVQTPFLEVLLNMLMYMKHTKKQCNESQLTLSIGPFWNTCGSSQTTQYSFSTGIRCSANSIVWEQQGTG